MFDVKAKWVLLTSLHYIETNNLIITIYFGGFNALKLSLEIERPVQRHFQIHFCSKLVLNQSFLIV